MFHSLPGQVTMRLNPTQELQRHWRGGWLRWLALIPAVAAIIATAAHAAAEAPGKTGYTLELWCMSDREDDRVACWHYLTGVGDGLTAARAFGKSTLCFDTTRPVPPEQLRGAFLDWAAKHPEFRDRPAANDAVAALLAAFPCPR
jgi:hypothetical protein